MELFVKCSLRLAGGWQMYDVILFICKMAEIALVRLPLFRQQRSFYGVNLAALHGPVVDEFLKRPIVVGGSKKLT